MASKPVPAFPEDAADVVALRPGSVRPATDPAVVATVFASCVPATMRCARPGAVCVRRLPTAPGTAGAAGRDDDPRGRP